jgi:hypothetical protein
MKLDLYPIMILLYLSDQDNCIRGFPDIVVSEVNRRTRNNNIVTLLIPAMNFTCDASIVGFIVAGKRLNNWPHCKIYVWQRNHSQNSDIYHQVGRNVSIHVPNGVAGGVCMAARKIVGDTFWCILKDNLQVQVQPGDVLGIELPQTNNIEILFTNGGPVNYIFDGRPGRTVNLSNNESFSKAQQLPQIVFNLTSGI